MPEAMTRTTNRSKSFALAAAAVSAGMMVIVASTGCAYLLFGPCGMYGCPVVEVTSLPPQDNPLARRLAQRTALERVESPLTDVVQAQYGLLEHRWPAEPQCEWVAAVGCRYRVPVREQRVSWSGQAEEMGCYILDVAVVDGPNGLPVVRRAGEMLRIQCPQP